MKTDLNNSISEGHAELKPVQELDGQILLDPATGRLHMRGAAVRLSIPILALRHGETNGNRRRVLQGQVDGRDNQLNATGREQAKLTAVNVWTDLQQRADEAFLQKLLHGDQLKVLTSPLRRARDTAECFARLLAEKTGKLVTADVEDNLKEISFGKYDGSTLEEIPDPDFTKLVAHYRATQDATVDWLGTGERFLDVVIRAKLLLEDLQRRFGNHLLVLFSHGTFISALRTAAGDESLVGPAGFVAFRDHIIGHAQPHWLHDSLARLKTDERHQP